MWHRFQLDDTHSSDLKEESWSKNGNPFTLSFCLKCANIGWEGGREREEWKTDKGIKKVNYGHHEEDKWFCCRCDCLRRSSRTICSPKKRRERERKREKIALKNIIQWEKLFSPPRASYRHQFNVVEKSNKNRRECEKVYLLRFFLLHIFDFNP